MYKPWNRLRLKRCDLYILLFDNLFFFEELSVCRKILNHKILSLVLFLESGEDGLFFLVHFLLVL